MATKKKAAKKSSASKKASPKKKSSKSQATELSPSISSQEESFAHEEEIRPSMPPVYTSSSQASQGNKDEDSGNSMLKYLVLAALILVGVIAYSLFSKKESYKPERAGSPVQEAEKKPTPPAEKVDEQKKSPELPPNAEEESSKFQGLDLSRIAEGKTYAEAVEYCKSMGLRLPRADEMKKMAQSGGVPSELKQAVIWVGDPGVSGKNLRYVFETNKNLFTDPKTKLKALCRK